jgi:DNA polymerase III subunit alpha
VKFYRAAEGAGIKPIAGADVLVAEGDEPPWRLTLLCRDRDGYLNLSRLLSRAFLEGHRGDGVVVRPDWLRDMQRRPVRAGRPPQRPAAAGASRPHDLAGRAGRLAAHFDDRLLPGTDPHRRDGEEGSTPSRCMLAQRRDLPVVASNDVRFLERTTSRRTRRACASPPAACWTTPSARATTAASST